jgi:uncharacterized protein YbaR (Trm112 family)
VKTSNRKPLSELAKWMIQKKKQNKLISALASQLRTMSLDVKQVKQERDDYKKTLIDIRGLTNKRLVCREARQAYEILAKYKVDYDKT